MAAYLGLSHRTIRNRVQCMKDEFLLEDGRIYEAEPEDDPESDLTVD